MAHPLTAVVQFAAQVALAGPQVAVALEGKGGGRGRRYQGKAKRLDMVAHAEIALRSALAAQYD